MAQSRLVKVADFNVVNHGVEYADYWQGFGVAFTEWEDCVTGCGYSEKEALDDALEQVAQVCWDKTSILGKHLDGIDVEDLESRIRERFGEPNNEPVVDFDEFEEDCDEVEDFELPMLRISICWRLPEIQTAPFTQQKTMAQ